MPKYEFLPDYTWNEEDDEIMNNYFTRASDGDLEDSHSSDGRDSNFHDQDSSLDHGRIPVTTLEGLEGPPMMIPTPSASPDQPGIQDSLKDVMVDVPSHEIGSKSLASKRRKLNQKQRKRSVACSS